MNGRTSIHDSMTKTNEFEGNPLRSQMKRNPKLVPIRRI